MIMTGSKEKQRKNTNKNGETFFVQLKGTRKKNKIPEHWYSCRGVFFWRDVCTPYMGGYARKKKEENSLASRLRTYAVAPA